MCLKQSWHTCPQKYADQQTAVMLPTGALRSCSCFNSAVCNECLLRDHYLPLFHECHSHFQVYDITSVDDPRTSQVFNMNTQCIHTS
jgi:hypothetical protein